MHIKEDIKPISYLKANAADILDRLTRTRRPMIITQNGEARAVIQDAGDYERMKTALGLLKLLAQSEADIQAGRLIEQGALFSAIEKKLGGV